MSHTTHTNDSPEEHSPERRRILTRGAQVLAAGGLFLAGRSALAQDAGATGNTGGTTGTMDSAGGTMAGDQAQMQASQTGQQQANPMQPLAPADADRMRATVGSMSGPQGMPASAVVAQVEKPGAAEANDVAILNFALTLEFLEAEFYSRVVAADDARAFLRGRPKDLVRALARDENTHVGVVTDAVRKLGGTPVEKPQFQFPAEAFISQIAFLQLSAQLEETGVSAYLGQAPLVRRRDVLNFAASIYGNEARHTALIRHYLGSVFAPRDLELPLTKEQVLERARPFIASS